MKATRCISCPHTGGLNSRRVHSVKKVIFFSLAMAIFIPVFCLWLPYSRNALLVRILPRQWYQFNTLDIVFINYVKNWTSEEDQVQVRDCFDTTPVPTTVPTFDTKLMDRFLQPITENVQAMRMRALSQNHGRFLPIISKKQKETLLNMYLLFNHMMAAGNVSFFLVDGALLGLYRYGGLIPWDDDIDIAVRWQDRHRIVRLLNCIEGYTVSVQGAQGHLKFHRIGQRYPFLDLFFYQVYEGYVFAVTHYLRQTFWYLEENTFPLTHDFFEGIRVPVPRKALFIMNKCFNIWTCTAGSPHISVNLSWVPGKYKNAFSVSTVPCNYLSYLYKLKRLAIS